MILTYITQFQYNSVLAILGYWIPAFIVCVVYVLQTVDDIKVDLETRKLQLYTPRVTIGSVLLTIVFIVTPVVNVICLVFDGISPVCKLILKVLRTPLIKKRRDYNV